MTITELIEQKDEQFYKENNYYQSINQPEIFAKEIAIEFAKYHVQKALETASNNAQLEHREYSKFYGKIERTMLMGQEINLEDQFYVGISENSILNSYPLTNII